ncbi:MAG: TauD/TfdA family dioxygenase [bacterium]|nr:TauD/TfdA family dioxygenase [Gammaproteobacteria bacterium]HIL97527.1 TauD/TfdA family dioxygenase [Pseudomonadales bacterium]
MSDTEITKLNDNPLYISRSGRAAANKPPSRSNPLGAVAESRFPGAANREEMVAGILSQDADLVAGDFGRIYYKPASVCGIELRLEPLQPSIGTVVHGIDLARDLDNPDMVTFLRELWLERRVIMFRNQNHLTREQMVVFAEHFGEVGSRYGERQHEPNSPHDLSHQINIPGMPDMLVLVSDEKVPSAAANWHSDATWQQRPPMGSVLMCREAPPIGGDTCFCDCYSMWEGLSRETKQRVEHLTAIHQGAIIHQMDGKTPVSRHPVARTHPETGRTALYVQQGFVQGFAEEHNIPKEEEKALLLEMKFQEGRAEYTCRFRWQTGSIAMWDNRAVLHSASADFWPHRRRMERLTILDRDKSRRTPYYSA